MNDESRATGLPNQAAAYELGRSDERVAQKERREKLEHALREVQDRLSTAVQASEAFVDSAERAAWLAGVITGVHLYVTRGIEGLG